MSQDLFDAIRNDEATKVASLLKANPKWIDEKDQRGSTPLLLASYYGYEATTKVILAYPQDIDAQDASGNTALMGVCFKGYDFLAKDLIDKGANVNATNFNGATALIFSATFNRIDMVTLLLANGADRKIKDDRGNTALDHAKIQGIRTIVELLSE